MSYPGAYERPRPAPNGAYKGSSGRRISQPDYAQLESPTIPDNYPPSNPKGLVQPDAVPGIAGRRNGVGKSNSHRRRESQAYAPPPPAANAGIEAPEVPRSAADDPYRKNRASYSSRVAPPPAPVEAAEPVYSGSMETARRSSSRRSYPPTSVPAPSYAGKNGAYTGRVVVDSVAPQSSGDPQRHSSSATTSSRRRSSVSERSPLQKLEGHLDSISKEERRAQVEEQEHLARQRSLARQQRRVSGPERVLTGTAPVERRNITAPAVPPGGGYPTGYPSQNSREATQQSRSRASGDYSGNRDLSKYYSGPPASNLRDPNAPLVVQNNEKVSQHGPTTGLGLYETTPPRARATNQGGYVEEPSSVGRSGSKKLQKNPPADSRQGTVNRTASGRHVDGYAVHPDTVRTGRETGPKYEIPPQSATGQQLRDQIGFGTGEPVHGGAGQKEHRFGGLFHHDHGEVRRYEPSAPSLQEWRNAPKASLTAHDLVLDEVPPPHQQQKQPNQAWWEKSGPRRSSGQTRTSGSSYPADDYDAAHEEIVPPTSYRPRLFTKCGPLLRFTGIRKDTRGKDIWRGTILIVTYDRQSDYTTVPTMRVFVQPQNLPPPPPAHVNEDLAADYVDPLAGHPKSSRTGKTLYVRPVEDLEQERDLSRVESDAGLFEENRTAPLTNFEQQQRGSHQRKRDGERAGKYREVRAHRLHAEQGCTFWRFNVEVELGREQARIGYRINRGPVSAFWVPARGESMNVMFYSCNGFSLSVNPDEFCGPDAMWRDVLNNHVYRPFHVMLGGGDQLYMDAITEQTELFRDWTMIKNPHHKHNAPFTLEMQDELEEFYFERYCMWFSQGFFGLANSMIPMVNMWDDHDIIDGFGSYPDHSMTAPVFSGVGNIAYKYYMLFQHQSVPEETVKDEPSWVLGAEPGPYINQLSRSVFMHLGRHVAFLGLDCRTERMRDEIMCQQSYDIVFGRLKREIIRGETKHLIVLLGIPIAYPRLNFLENLLTSRVMDPVKALSRAGIFGGLVNKFDGGVEILDDLNDHWTAKHHKAERNWFVQELQVLAAEKSVRITILGGDVHLCAIGQFYSNKKLAIPKDRDHRYMPNVISSAIVNTPPPVFMADVLNKRNKVHRLDPETDEHMIPLFTHDVDHKPRNNQHLLPRRNWCSIREYHPGHTPPPTPPHSPSAGGSSDRGRPNSSRDESKRSSSVTRRDFTPGGLVRRLSGRRNKEDDTRPERQSGPPVSFYNRTPQVGSYPRRASSDGALPQPNESSDSYFTNAAPPHDPPRPNPFHRQPTGLSEKAMRRGGAADDEREGHIDLEGGLDIVINVEINQKDPAGITTPYRLLVPALNYDGPPDPNTVRREGRLKNLIGTVTGRRKSYVAQSDSYDDFQTPMATPPPPASAHHIPESAHAQAQSRAAAAAAALSGHHTHYPQHATAAPPPAGAGPVDHSYPGRTSTRTSAPPYPDHSTSRPVHVSPHDVPPPPTSNTAIRGGMPVRKQYRDRSGSRERSKWDGHPGYNPGREHPAGTAGVYGYSGDSLTQTETPGSEGVPQRRERHYVETDFGGAGAGKEKEKRRASWKIWRKA